MASKKGMDKDTKLALEVGAGVIAAAAVAGAGYYFYGDKSAKKHRAAATKWAKGMKADVLKEAKKLKEFDQKAMAAVVDKVSAAYATARSVDQNDFKAAVRELKKNWRKIADELGGAKKKVTKTVKKAPPAAKKTVKKAVKKTPKRAS